MSTFSYKKHWVTVAWPEWGHCRSALTLAARIVNNDSSHRITFLTHHHITSKTANELKRLVSEEEFNSDILKRVNVIGLEPIADSKVILHGAPNSWFHGKQLIEAAIHAWPVIHPRHAGISNPSTRTIHCSLTSQIHDFALLPEPSVVLNDMFTGPVAEYLRFVEMDVKIQIYMWFSSDVSRFLIHTGAHEQIGSAKWATKNIEQIECESESTESQKYQELSRRFSEPQGFVVQTPGLPDMFDYEFNPCNFPAPGILFESLMGTRKQALHLTNGSIVATSHSFQPTGVQACKRRFEGDLHKEVFCVGPPLPRRPSLGQEGDANRSNDLIFMDKALTKYGAQSVVLISFGTCYFPSHRPEQFTMLIRTLLKATSPPIPFIYSTASDMFQEEQMDPTLLIELAQAQKDGRCYGSKWLSQRDILQHEAMGVFVSHCGYNSCCEANAYGVPLVAWPLVGDQPSNAAYQSSVLSVAWELLNNKDRPSLRLKSRHHYRSYLRTPEADWSSEKQAAFQAELERILLVESRPNNMAYIQRKSNAIRLQKNLQQSISTHGEAEEELKRLKRVDEPARRSGSRKASGDDKRLLFSPRLWPQQTAHQRSVTAI